MSKRNYHWFKGFTMIELVMVIVIIGILAAAALPRFANLTGQAQIAANQGVAGALRSAVGVAHAAWIAAGASGSAASVSLDNTVVATNGQGWPEGVGGSGTTMTLASCTAVFTGVLANAPSNSQSPSTCTDTPCYVVSVSGASCIYSLYGGGNAVAGRTITYNSSTGAVAAT